MAIACTKIFLWCLKLCFRAKTTLLLHATVQRRTFDAIKGKVLKEESLCANLISVERLQSHEPSIFSSYFVESMNNSTRVRQVKAKAGHIHRTDQNKITPTKHILPTHQTNFYSTCTYQTAINNPAPPPCVDPKLLNFTF